MSADQSGSDTESSMAGPVGGTIAGLTNIASASAPFRNTAAPRDSLRSSGEPRCCGLTFELSTSACRTFSWTPQAIQIHDSAAALHTMQSRFGLICQPAPSFRHSEEPCCVQPATCKGENSAPISAKRSFMEGTVPAWRDIWKVLHSWPSEMVRVSGKRQFLHWR